MALNNYDDPQWLGESSPLAAPYFLGESLNEFPNAHTAEGRGHALQKAIQLAADTLWNGPLPTSREELESAVQEARLEKGNSGNRYYFFLLDLRYLRRYFRPRANPSADSELAIRNYLGVGRGPYFNHLKAARTALGETLISLLQPTFRLEKPPKFEGRMIGREALINQCLSDLSANRSIALTGMGGSGKTSLASVVAEKWAISSVFWFTLWPSVNNQASSLLFSLGYFLHKRGASGLWLQLVANHGQLDNLSLAIEQARGALHALDPQPLLCIDELNLLNTDPDKILPAQQKLLGFLESLRGLAPVLLIGQQVNLVSDVHYTLQGLTPKEIEEVLDLQNVPYSGQEITHLHSYTGGNARMVWLCASLSRNGHTLANVLGSLPEAAPFQVLFARFWQSLSQGEQQFIKQISVFRSPGPIDAFAKEARLISKLSERHILQKDGQGAITLLPIIRDLVYEDHQRLSAEEREKAHLIAAGIRAERGEYTAAANHFFQGGEPGLSVQVWYPHRQQEIQRGKSEAALEIFAKLSNRRLSKDEAEALTLIKAELYQLTGQTEKGLAELKAVNWDDNRETTISAHLLQGTFLNSLGYPQNALEKLENGQAVIARLLQQLVRFRQQRAVVHIQQWQMEEAIQEVRLAQYTTEHLQGQIHEQQGSYEEAYLAYNRALVLAKSTGNESGVAQTNRDLATLMMRQSRLEEAKKLLQDAMDYYDATGDRLSLEKARSTQIGIHFQAGEFEEVIAIGKRSLSFFEKAKIPYYAGAISSNIAESYFELGDFEKAQFYAHKTLSFEETHPYPYALYTLGLIHQAKGEDKSAEKFFRQSLAVATENDDVFLKAYAQRQLGELLADHGHSGAEDFLLQALNLFKQLKFESEINKTEYLLAKRKHHN